MKIGQIMKGQNFAAIVMIALMSIGMRPTRNS